MKDMRLVAWLSQLAFSVTSPLLVCILGAVWLRQHFGLGAWVVILGVVLGIGGAVSGFLSSLRAMNRILKAEDKKKLPPSFNDHE